MIPLFVMLGAGFVASPAHAASHEINAEAGWIGSPDQGWELFSPSQIYGTGGLRIGYAVHERVTAIAGWQHGQTGMTVATEGDYDEEGNAAGFHTGFYGDTFTLGAKADVRLAKWLHPYVAVQGALLAATARIDDDLGEDDNIGQLSRGGVTGGGIATVGLDFPIHFGSSPVAIAPYAEFGYGVYAPLRLGDLGSFQMSGFAGRTGIGLRF